MPPKRHFTVRNFGDEASGPGQSWHRHHGNDLRRLHWRHECAAEAAAPDLRSGSLREVIQALPAAAADRAVLVFVVEAQVRPTASPAPCCCAGRRGRGGLARAAAWRRSWTWWRRRCWPTTAPACTRSTRTATTTCCSALASGCRGAVTPLLLPGTVRIRWSPPAAGAGRGARNARAHPGEDGAGSARIDTQACLAGTGAGGGRQWTLRLPPPPRLLLLGVGPEAAPLIRHARAGLAGGRREHRGAGAATPGMPIGWSTRRPRPPGPSSTRRATAPRVVMSHHYGHDLVHLQHLQQSRIGYVGLPVRRRGATPC